MAGDPARQIERNSVEAEAAYENAPAGLRAELLHGVVCMVPAPAPRHQLRVGRLFRRLSPYDRIDHGPRDPGGWVFILEPELHLGERPEKVKPDIAGWREKRATFDSVTPAITIAPDWVCEVLSPSTETIDRGTKAPLYAEQGVEWLWLVDPAGGSVEVFRNERGAFRSVRTHRAGDGVALPPFELATLARLFED